MKLLLALLAGGKFAKVALSGGTMLLSVFAYALLFGWAYGVALVGLIFIHEMGHFIAARRNGLAVGAPVFIPFVGAWVSIKDDALDDQTMAQVALAGPVLGSVAAFLSYLYWDQTGSSLWLAIAYAGFFINLINLIPIGMLDGGRIVKVVSTRLWLLGVPLLIAAFVWQPSPLLLVFGIAALPELWGALRGHAPPTTAPLQARIRIGAAYLGLSIALAIMAYQSHEQLAHLRH
ncbi:hypothetical protein BH10PSE17_BH10PSE17_13840 [soil metagenome]